MGPLLSSLKEISDSKKWLAGGIAILTVVAHSRGWIDEAATNTIVGILSMLVGVQTGIDLGGKVQP